MRDDFIMQPKIDFAFKEIMSHSLPRIGFISSVMNIDPESIKKTEILKTDLKKVHADDKLGILDVRVNLEDHTEIDIEIQIAKFKAWADRTLFYLSKMYSDQMMKGEHYDTLKRCINISILDFNLFGC